MASTVAAFAPVAVRPVAAAPLKQAKNTFAARTVSNGSIQKTTAMQGELRPQCAAPPGSPGSASARGYHQGCPSPRCPRRSLTCAFACLICCSVDSHQQQVSEHAPPKRAAMCLRPAGFVGPCARRSRFGSHCGRECAQRQPAPWWPFWDRAGGSARRAPATHAPPACPADRLLPLCRPAGCSRPSRTCRPCLTARSASRWTTS